MPQNLFDPNLDMYALSILAVIAAATLSIYLIVKVTRRSIMAQLEASMRNLASVTNGVAHGPTFVTFGMGEVAWRPDGLIYPMLKTHVVASEDDAKAQAENSFDSLVTGLAEKGFDPRDVVETKDPSVRPHENGFAYFSHVSVLIRDGSRKGDVDLIARAEGYVLGDEAIEMISTLDAHRTAGHRAIEDAVENAATVAESLSLPVESFGMTDVKLVTSGLPTPGGTIVKTAEISWRRTSR